MPNMFAYLVLFSWPVVVFFLFRRLSRAEALAWSVLGGYLALPFDVGVDFPVLPALSKDLIPALAAAIMVLIMGAEDGKARRRKAGAPEKVASAWHFLPLPGVFLVLLAVYILAPLATSWTNPTPLQYGPRQLKGITLYDGFSFVQSAMITLLPLLLAQRIFARPEAQRVLLRVFVLCGAIYSLPILYEVRMSPQLAKMTYGFLAQSFAQTNRGGGFRPVVFLQHGLWLALFVALAALAAWALFKIPARAPSATEPSTETGRGSGLSRARRGQGGQKGQRGLWMALWLVVVLVLCKSLGATALFGLMLGIFFLPLRGQFIFAAVIAAMVLVYPMLRGAGMIPVETINAAASSLSGERGESFAFRLRNEDKLLDRANERPLFGWGAFGRPLVFDPTTGRKLTIPDGMWVIVMGEGGWVGYLTTYGILCLPILLLALRRRRLGLDTETPEREESARLTAALVLMMTLNLVDSISNATITPITWLLAGALIGRLRLVPARAAEPVSSRRAQSRRPAQAARTPRAAALLLLPCLCLFYTPATLRAADLPAGVGLADPTLAYGLSSVNDWGTSTPFLDLMKSARPFLAHSQKEWSFMDHAQLRAGGYLDAQGWPLRLPEGASAIGTIWSWKSDSPAAATRAGTYVLRHAGQGRLHLKGEIEILRERPGEIVFRNPTGGVMMLDITETNPADPIRALTLVRQDRLALFEMGEIFNPDWLAVVEDARVLRFMDWMETNGRIGAQWADRPRPEDATYAEEGVPVEVMVALANKVGAEPWFTLPMAADDDYIRGFATYVRDHLKAGLVAHAEYSNEAWNWAFPQTKWLGAEAKARWESEDRAAWLDMQAMLATRAALIWKEVYGAEADLRLDTVLATQTVNLAVTRRLLEAPLWQEHDPEGWVAPSSVFDSLAVTTYFGGAIVPDADLRAALTEKVRADPAQARLWLDAVLRDPEMGSSIPRIAAKWQEAKDLIAPYGMALIAYEGGQHLLQSFPRKGVQPGEEEILLPFLADYIRSPHMADLYQTLWEAWAQVGQGPFMQFGEVAPPAKSGSWGLYAFLGDRNPRAERLVWLNQIGEPWFGNGPADFYQQGVFQSAGAGGEVLSGSLAADVLAGGAGDDRFRPGQGADVVSGGGGRDIVIFDAPRSAYRLTQSGQTVRVLGAGLDLQMQGIPLLAFPDPKAPSGQILLPLAEALAE